MGVQILRGIHSKMPKENHLREVAHAPGQSVSQIGSAEEKLDIGRAYDARSRTHAHSDSVGIFTRDAT